MTNLQVNMPLIHQAPSRVSAVPIPSHMFISKNRSVLVLAALAMLATASMHAQAERPRLTLDEFFNAVDFTKIVVSPDGHMVVIATDRADWKNARFRQDLWLWRDGDGALIPLTQSGHDSDPKWSPDGKWIAFVSDRNDSDKSDADSKEVTHVYLIPISGGEALPVTRGSEDVHSFAWSADSKSVYFAARSPWTKKQKEDYEEKWKDVVRYREQERGDVISRIAVEEALKRQIELGAHEKKSKKDKTKEEDDDEETGETPGSEVIVTSPYRVK
ncbi:MAG TPA: DPP IV N-terminal domain-containing protein, partial [Terriglobales bacterium]